ncbi:MAG: RluA family pseudouridine synthase [Lachnospiraceae bacterium]|nr:RluA family pseudouridine synthase [Lachnospiraceae bacterium]
MSDYRELSCRIDASTAGLTIRQVIKKTFGLVDHDISRAKYRKDGIRLNGTRVFVSTVTSEGDELVIRIEDEPAGRTVPRNGPLQILYEDEDLLALNKPAGIVVHPSHGHYADSLGNYVAGYYERCGRHHDSRTIGRLDMETSGVILYGKTRSSVSLMMKEAEMGRSEKTYLALAEGIFEHETYDFDGPIGRVDGEKLLRMVRPDGDRALTHVRVLKQYADYALVRVNIETGRTHQIRVHLSNAGHPLLGDTLYGNTTRMDRAALHCWESRFEQLYTGVPVTIRASLPADMAAFIDEDTMALLGPFTPERSEGQYEERDAVSASE